ncbi:MAG: hypothetical protein J1E28_00445 [Helicobacter sp.]|uniref:hypothetical protein n=1 Tax=Helicobacter sp. TaxID=218 RepID=UPI0025BF0BBE|nr:hypothetical protein [Helicobacter sp.]MCH5312858.1 hypothetical protein [Helicobacter sp.]
MKKYLFALLFGFYTQYLMANECFRIDGVSYCNNDVIEISNVSFLLKVYDIGRGQVRYELYVFNYTKESEEALKGDPVALMTDSYFYESLRVGKSKKLYSNTPQGRKIFFASIKKEKDKEKNFVNTYINKCITGAKRYSKGSEEAERLLKHFCFRELEVDKRFEKLRYEKIRDYIKKLKSY